MPPTLRTARPKKTKQVSKTKRRPRVGDVVDVFWDDRQVYFRGKLIKRWLKFPFGFYIRYEDGDYISTNLDHFSWHFAGRTLNPWDECCKHAKDFCPGDMDDMWSSDASDAEDKQNHTHVESQKRIPAANHASNHPQPTDRANPPQLLETTTAVKASTSEAINVHDVKESNHSSRSSSRLLSDYEQSLTPDKNHGERVCNQQDIVYSIDETSLSRGRVSETFSPGTSDSDDATNSVKRRFHSTKGPDSTTMSCQSLTTTEGLSLLEHHKEQNSSQGNASEDFTPTDSCRLTRNLSQAGMSYDAHWKRRIRSRFASEGGNS